MKKMLLIYLLICVSAVAGEVTSGGGGAFLCNENGKATTELLDIWESHNVYGYPTEETNLEYKDIILDKMKKLYYSNPGFATHVQKSLDFIFKNTIKLNEGVELMPPSDAHPVYNKPKCKLVGMMFFDGYLNKLVIDYSVFDLLIDQNNIAASYLHEAVYLTLRQVYSDRDSRRTRRIVGRLFSFKTNEERVQETPYIRCTGTNVDYTLSSSSKGYSATFYKLGEDTFEDGFKSSFFESNESMNCLEANLNKKWLKDLKLFSNEVDGEKCTNLGKPPELILSRYMRFNKSGYATSSRFDDIKCVEI